MFRGSFAVVALGAVLTGAAGWSRDSKMPRDHGAPARADSAAVTQTVDAFDRAIAAGDTASVLDLLSADAVVLESGGIETRAEYAAHHLAADIAFRKAIPAASRLRRVVVVGDVAWVTSTGVSKGTFDGRAINSAGAELMVLSRDGRRRGGARWRIRAIHWSSHRLSK